MPTKYVTSKTAQLQNASTGKKTVLIFGDEVKTSGSPEDGHIKAEFRGVTGLISEKQIGSKPALEIYFIDVGQGDSVFIVTPGRKKILIDGGVGRRALGFLAWKYRLGDSDTASVDIDLLVLSHADSDHIEGLIPIIQSPKINVRKVVHNGIATFKKDAYDTGLGKLSSDKTLLITRHDDVSDLDESSLDKRFSSWCEALKAEGTSCTAIDSSMGTLDIGDPDISIEILGPRIDSYKGKPALKWFKDVAHTINGHSVVLRLKYKNVSILLPGDINMDGADYLIEESNIKAKADAHVFKAPHHGSHEYSLPFLEAIKPQISVISSGDEPDHGHPRAIFIGAVGHVSRSSSPLVFSTEIAATFVEEKGKTQ